MTPLLRQAFDALSVLPPGEQDALAERLLAELADEDEFDRKLQATGHLLAGLIAEAMAEAAAGETLPLDPDEL